MECDGWNAMEWDGMLAHGRGELTNFLYVSQNQIKNCSDCFHAVVSAVVLTTFVLRFRM